MAPTECVQACGEGGVTILPLDSAFDVVDPLGPRPDVRAIAEDEYERLLTLLNREDTKLQAIAIRKAQGFSNEEIAVELDMSISTVKRKLQEIRAILGPQVQEDE
jgi:DNA-directed RNA polymerase specialized sigma24 family protein